MSYTVAIAGGSGYAGGEVLRLLLAHPEFEIGHITAHSNVGARVGSIHQHLTPLADRVFTESTPENLGGHDVVIMALPHGASGSLAAQLPDSVLVLDCGADHRLIDSAAWRAYYGSDHAGTWPYGLPELLYVDGTRGRDRLDGVNRIAVPGCNVTAVTLALAPGIYAGLIDSTDLGAVLANGYSGAGRTLKPHLLASEALGSATPYAVGGVHRHIPEIHQNLLAAGAPEVTISFTPTLVPMSRGILATCTARVRPGVSTNAIRSAWQDIYHGEPFVQLLPEGQWPSTAAVLGSNNAHIQVAVDEAAGRLVAIAAIDNLVKGTAGAAVQSANIALGLTETLGLPRVGVAP